MKKILDKKGMTIEYLIGIIFVIMVIVAMIAIFQGNSSSIMDFIRRL